MKYLAYKCPSCEQLAVAVNAAGFLVCTFNGCSDRDKIHEVVSDAIIANSDIEVEDLVGDEDGD